MPNEYSSNIEQCFYCFEFAYYLDIYRSRSIDAGGECTIALIRESAKQIDKDNFYSDTSSNSSEEEDEVVYNDRNKGIEEK